MIVALLLLCAVRALCSAGAKIHTCVPNEEVECFLPADHLNASDPVSVDLPAGKKLRISLEGLDEHLTCQWLRGADSVLTTNGSRFMTTLPLSESASGRYTLTCEAPNGSRSLAVDLHVLMERPTKPHLMLEGLNLSRSSVLFKCASESVPKPTINWTKSKVAPKLAFTNRGVESTISSTAFSTSQVMCCATNAEGQECSQIYNYDVNDSKMKPDEVSEVTLSPGQSLVLRCRFQEFVAPMPEWETVGKVIASDCADGGNEVCIKTESHKMHLMAYLFIKSLRAEHSGDYTCRSPTNQTKTVRVHVHTEGFLSAQLDERTVVPAQEASSSCLQATVSYHPVLQHCLWEAPDKSVTKCVRDEWVTKHRTVKLCDSLKSGEYKLHLKSGDRNETKSTSVCIVDDPKFELSLNEVRDNFILETASLVPANHSWMSCPTSNGSCETAANWEAIPNTARADTSVLCHKTIRSALSREQVDEHHVKFCLTNSVGSWCHEPKFFPALPQPSKSESPENDSLMLLKVGSLFLLLALTLVSFVLVHFIRKKKPQYEPQLQIIQMVGPNDNDYIYINFKDFEYDRKLEFPRENLELGKELGSGAFGMVVQATAYGINKPGVSQQVAVKMLKEKHQSVEKEALMSELKMLTHIGQHVNIVNLLGACTDSGPTYLIFQYCCYGDLLNYLKNNSERYHKSVTDAFNKDRFSSLYHNMLPRKNSSELEGALNHYMPMYGSTTRGQEDIALLTLNSSDMDGYEDPEVYETDDQSDDLQALTFDDLLNFAFQVAKGMEFLSSKNCIHRDLAARNVLVTKGRLVKIGDFGLARDIDNDSNYVVRGNVRLPVKWMAPESIFHGMYTTKSDVWAYGILLWEIFSLGITPYPGMKVDHTFYSMIEKGFKMEAPYYANESVYEMMCHCWALEPCSRPAFSKLVSFMCDQLTDREEKLFHNILDQTSSHYQNTSAIVDISALTKENKNAPPAANDYCQTPPTEDGRAETSSDTVGAEKEHLKPSE